MANAVKNPDMLNDLLKEILLALFNQAQGHFEDRTGRVVKMSRLQSMKLNAASRLVNMGVHQLDRFGDPQARFDRFAKLSNDHLPSVVDAVGEEAIVQRLRKMPPHVLNRDVVGALHDAGAHEIAELLGKAVPQWESRRAPKAAAPVVEEKPAAEEFAAVATPEVKAEEAKAEDPPAAPAPEKVEEKVAEAVKPAATGDAAQLRQHLKALESMQAQLTQRIAEVRGMAEAAERAPAARPAQWYTTMSNDKAPKP